MNVKHGVWPIVCAYDVVGLTRIIIISITIIDVRIIKGWKNFHKDKCMQLLYCSCRKSYLGPTSGEAICVYLFFVEISFAEFTEIIISLLLWK